MNLLKINLLEKGFQKITGFPNKPFRKRFPKTR